MHTKAKPPIFVPLYFRPEIEQLSKAALMDMVWDYAQQSAGTDAPDKIMEEFQRRREIVLAHRKQAA